MQQPSVNPRPPEGSVNIDPQSSDDTAINLASHQPDTPSKEVLVFVLIGVLREVLNLLASGLKTPGDQIEASLKNWLYWVAQEERPAIAITCVSLVIYTAVMLISKRRIPRRILDGIGMIAVFTLLLQFLKINLLLLTPSGPAGIVLAQVIVFVLYFSIVWGWILWRLDAATNNTTQSVIALDGADPPITMFDYYHLSTMSIIRRGGIPPLRGVSKLGMITLTIHNLMLLDLYGVILGRFYQLLQKSI